MSKPNEGALQSGLTQQEVLRSKKIGGSNPFTDITITTSPLFKNPPDILADDLHGERALTTRINSDLERTVSTPTVTQYRDENQAAKDRLMSGYFDRDASGRRVYKTTYGTVPAADQGKGEK